MIEEALLKIQKSLDGIPFIEVGETSLKSDQVNLLCRSKDATPDERHVLGLVHHLLESEDGWQSHICKKYFMRDGDMKFGWSLSFRADDMVTAAAKIARSIRFHAERNILPEEDDAGQAFGRKPVRARKGGQSPKAGSYRGATPTGG
jgi:hypothetical protein